MQMPVDKVNFSEVIRGLKEAGAFDCYDQETMGGDPKKVDSDLGSIKQPGDEAYSNGPMWITRFEVSLPQPLINAQRKSFLDAINMYMPAEFLGQWMHEYFADNFLSSPSFQHVMREVELPYIGIYKSGRVETADESLSFNLSAPERKVRNRRLFTVSELEATIEIAKEHPEMVATVAAYQASFVGYLMKLDGELKFGEENFNPEEKIKAQAVVDSLKKAWVSDNFMDNILPAVAISYYNNHDGDLSAKPTRDDFAQGMQFAWRSGAFTNEIQAPDEEKKQFSCPARTALTRASAADIDKPDGIEGVNVAKSAGSALGQIYEKISALIEKSDPAATKTMESVRAMVDKAQGQNR